MVFVKYVVNLQNLIKGVEYIQIVVVKNVMINLYMNKRKKQCLKNME